MVDFNLSSPTDATPTFLVGGNGANSLPSKAPLGATGLAIVAAANQAAAQAAVGTDPAGAAAAAQAAAIAASAQRANNLSDLASKPTALSNLGVGAVVNVAGPLTLTNAHYGATLVMGGNYALTINTGLLAGFGCIIEGQFTVAGTATVSGTPPTTGFSALVQDGTNAYKIVVPSAGTAGLLPANNLSDVVSAPTALSNLGGASIGLAAGLALALG